MVNTKAPSAGTKVDLGQNAPITREPAGNVDPNSLAAESYQQSGEFASNRGAAPESTSTSNYTKSSFEPVNKKTTSSYANALENHSTEKPTEMPSASHQPEIPGNGATAPSYVVNQYIRDQNAPHGRNIQEVGTFEGEEKLQDGIQKAFNATPGSEMDPSRRAEREMEYKGNTTANKGKNFGLEGEGTTYEVLDAEKRA